MYILEWKKLESIIMEKLAGKIERIQYIGNTCEREPILKDTETYHDGNYWTYSDADYNHNAILGFWALVKNKCDISLCCEEIYKILEKEGYPVLSKPSCTIDDNGIITLTVKFYPNTSMDKALWGNLSKDDEK